MKFQARFIPYDSTIKSFYHEIEAENSYEAESSYYILASLWNGKFEDISRIL